MDRPIVVDVNSSNESVCIVDYDGHHTTPSSIVRSRSRSTHHTRSTRRSSTDWRGVFINAIEDPTTRETVELFSVLPFSQVGASHLGRLRRYDSSSTVLVGPRTPDSAAPSYHIGSSADPSTLDAAPNLSDGTESGWATIAKSIREVDEQKIKDYKEDIDTILVFAGLYSAVLSALLVESFQALQPDPNVMMISLLAQIVAQTNSYTFNSGYLNSTAPPMAAPVMFQPTSAAKRINILWFASLTLSLITASFGILVKQWLREYLSGEYISPQARLRTRHFRNPGLTDWHVFGIAALLPLVLQLALALFFVGLCFFTLDIHSSVGNTTIPLVAGWAFLFVAALLSPAISPRCPYKVPLLKPVMELLRSGLFRLVQVAKAFPVIPDKSSWNISRKWVWTLLAYTEDDAAKNSHSDVDILVAVDAIQTDDQLVLKMCSALQEVHTEPEVVVEFVLKILGLRLGTSFPIRPLPMMLDLLQLPVRTSTILMDAIAEALRREVLRYPQSRPIEWTPWMRDCLALLVARLPCQLSEAAAAVVALCFTDNHQARIRGSVGELIPSVEPDERFDLCLHIFQRLRSALQKLDISQFHYTTFLILRRCCCTCNNPRVTCYTFNTLFENHVLPPVVRDYICELHSDYLLRQIQSGISWGEWHRELSLTVFEQYSDDREMTPFSDLPWHNVLKELGRHLTLNRHACPVLYQHLYHPTTYNRFVAIAFHDTYVWAAEKEEILTTLHDSFADYVRVQMTQLQPVAQANAFFVHLLMFFYGQYHPMWSTITVHALSRLAVREQFVPIWQQIWQKLHDALSLFNPVFVTDELTGWAISCLSVIDIVDGIWLPSDLVGGPEAAPDEHFEAWAKTFPVHESFFSDNLIEALMQFLPSFEGVASRRVRRILWFREHPEYLHPTITQLAVLSDSPEPMEPLDLFASPTREEDPDPDRHSTGSREWYSVAGTEANSSPVSIRLHIQGGTLQSTSGRSTSASHSKNPSMWEIPGLA